MTIISHNFHGEMMLCQSAPPVINLPGAPQLFFNVGHPTDLELDGLPLFVSKLPVSHWRQSAIWKLKRRPIIIWEVMVHPFISMS